MCKNLYGYVFISLGQMLIPCSRFTGFMEGSCLNFIRYFFLYVHEFDCMDGYKPVHAVPLKAKGVRFLVTRVRDGCELPCASED